MKKHLIIQSSCILILFVLTGCSNQKSNLTGWPMYEGAENISSYSGGSFEQRKEIGFNVKAKYPKIDVAVFCQKVVKSPWKPCFNDIEWDSFGDVS